MAKIIVAHSRKMMYLEYMYIAGIWRPRLECSDVQARSIEYTNILLRDNWGVVLFSNAELDVFNFGMLVITSTVI